MTARRRKPETARSVQPIPSTTTRCTRSAAIFGVVGVQDAANFVALGLHALQHRGQEAGGIVTYAPESGFNQARRFGYVRDNFTKRRR